MKETDWKDLREAYVKGRCLVELAEQFGTTPDVIAQRVRDGGWQELRQAEYLRRRQEAGLDPEGEYWLDGVRLAASALTGRVCEGLQEANAPPRKPEELLKWAGVVRELAAIMRALYGVPSFAEREAWRLQEKKIDCDRAAPSGGDGRVFLPAAGE